MEAIPVGIFWVFAAWGMVGKRPILLYLFFCSMSFGSFAAIPPALTGGLTFTPTPMVGMLIILRCLGSLKALEYAASLALNTSRLMLLFLFWLIAVFTTIFMPRLFAGQVEVMPMRSELPILAVPLQPTTQNISQLAYLTISVLAVFAFARLLRTPEMRQHALQAMVMGGLVAVMTGLLDFTGQYLPIQPLLEPFRTATYALLTDVEVLGAKRVVGLMPEASAFGSLSLIMLVSLYYFRRALTDQFLRNRMVPPLLAALVLMVWLSTSSAAYVGLTIFAMMAALDWLWRVFAVRRNDVRRRGLGVEFWTATGGIAVLCIVALFYSSLLDPIIDMVDRMVFQKTASRSFEERGMWTTVSWQAFLDTYWLGVGVGSTRASNGVVAVFSNTGLIGALLYYGFLLQTFLRKAKRNDKIGAALISAFRWSFVPGFVTGLLAGTSADFGTFGAFRFALMMVVASTSLSQPQGQTHSMRRKVPASELKMVDTRWL